MSDTPDPLTPPDTPPVRDRRIVVTAALSIVLHLMIIALLMLPRLPLPEAAEPPPINVDLVPPEAVPSEPPPAPSQAPSVEPVSSSQPPPSELASSASAEAAPSAERAASEMPSAAAASSAEAASAAPSEARSRPIVIPVGPSAPSSEPASSLEAASSEDPSAVASDASSAAVSSAASEGDSSVLATASTGGGDTVAEPASAEPASAAPPPITGALHTARRFYLAAILDAPAMAKAKDAIRKLPAEKRLTQTCNIEAVGQLGNAGRGFAPDAVVADAFGKPAVETDAATVTVSSGAFRSGQKWYGVAYTCRLSPDLSSVKSFSYRVGEDVTAALKARLGR